MNIEIAVNKFIISVWCMWRYWKIGDGSVYIYTNLSDLIGYIIAIHTMRKSKRLKDQGFKISYPYLYVSLITWA